ncbi:hypothetical protein HAX54_014458 [Datura stramonium]|uniref:Uncharacterized protein n=1 Tax=Datura stramonium TaxID=4076 RepID=A0ABS8RIQ6_DATST|nr:hypothetical protein [Datura stramonium]
MLLQHEGTLSELVKNGHHYPSPDPARTRGVRACCVGLANLAATKGLDVPPFYSSLRSKPGAALDLFDSLTIIPHLTQLFDCMAIVIARERRDGTFLYHLAVENKSASRCSGLLEMVRRRGPRVRFIGGKRGGKVGLFTGTFNMQNQTLSHSLHPHSFLTRGSSSGIGGGNFRREVRFLKERTTRVALLKKLVGEFFCGGGGVVDCGGSWLSDQWGMIVLLAILEHSFHGKFWKLG